MASLENVSAIRAQIADIDKAISAAHLGQSYSIGGRSVTRQDVSVLQDERGRLVRRLQATEATLQGATDGGTAIASWHR